MDGIALDSGLEGHGSLPSARLKYCNRDIRARIDAKVRTKTLEPTRLDSLRASAIYSSSNLYAYKYKMAIATPTNYGSCVYYASTKIFAG